ncbi:BTAD domain-containing putative transcriptional regulator [Mycobacterium paraterrae]
MELGVLGPLQVRQDGVPVAVPGTKPRAILTMLGLQSGSVVSADTLVELLWGENPPRTAAKALQTHISLLRRALGDGFVLTEGSGWTLADSDVDAARYKAAARLGRDAAAAGDSSRAVARFDEALALWRGIPELPDGHRGRSEKTRWVEGHAALVEDRAEALLATGRAAEVIGDLEAAVAEAPLRERRWGQLMRALYRAGRQGEALAAYQRARSLLADELGVDPGPELRRIEAAIVAQDASLDVPAARNLPAVTRAVTFLLTDIEGSTVAWEADATAMGVALARHDELVERVVTSRGGLLIKTRGEGDATFSVFDRPSAAAAAAIELQDAIVHEPWALREPMRVRVALHTGEAELRDGDYFGRAVNRAARLRSLAEGGQILCSGATAELVIDSLPDDVLLIDLGMRQLKNLTRPEHVFELRLETADDHRQEVAPEAPIERPSLPAVLAGHGPFVGRGHELGQLFSVWQTTLAGGTNAALIAGEPGVGKTRLAGEWSRQAYEQGALVIYGRCDEDLGAAYQPFAEALRSLVPCLASKGLRGLRGVEALLALVPGLTDVLPDLAAPTRSDPDTERYALFDAVVAVCELACASSPVVLILDDLHWAAKPTLLLLRHLLRFGDHARMQIVGTYRGTDLDRTHPLAAMLADLHRDGTACRIQLGGLDENDVTTYVAEAGYDDEELARALASVTGGNPFFLIEALRHVDESGGVWDPSTLPQGVRETVSRRLSRLSVETNTALAAAAVVGSRFSVDLVEQVVDEDLVDAFDEACKAGLVIEEPGGRYRFNHAIVRQSLLAELPSVRRLRLHQRIAVTLETRSGADDELLADLAYHYFECAWAGNAAKAVDYCRRAADQAMARLGYEGAADLYDHALHALEEIDDELPDRDDQVADLLVARCEALLAAGDVTTATGAVAQLQRATADSARLAAWATCFDGELAMLVHPERLDEIETALAAAASTLAELNDAAGEAKAHTVRATCLARLGRVGDCEIALDDALTAARRAGEHRRVNAVLAGAPLAALWGPNPVPRAGGRCLDVVRLLRITTDSPAVEATSTRCQAVLEAFRGRAEAARRMIDSARRTVTELGLRHALVEVEQFSGIVELVAGDPAAAEPHLRQAYNGFRRMGLDADTAETAALLGRACLALDREAEADELCTESQLLAGHALKPAIAWRTLRAQLLSRRGDHDQARRIAEAAVALAERTDALVDHGDACLSLATVLSTAGDDTAARATAEQAANLYERKGAAALAERARSLLGERDLPSVPAPPEAPGVKPDNAAVRVGERVMDAIHRNAWDEVERLFAPTASVESRRKVVGFKAPSAVVRSGNRRDFETGATRVDHVIIAARGDRLALARLVAGTADTSPGAPRDEYLQLYSIDEEGRIASQVWFDVEDIDAAVAELDSLHIRFEQEQSQTRWLENSATRADDRFEELFAERRWDEIGALLTDDIRVEDRRKGVRRQSNDRAAELTSIRAIADLGGERFTCTPLALRGDRVCLSHLRLEGSDARPDKFDAGGLIVDALSITEVDADGMIVARTHFDADDFEAAIAELDSRYLAGEAAPYAHTWSVIMGAYAAVNRHEIAPTTTDFASMDHRQGTKFAPGELIAYLRATWDLEQQDRTYIEAVHRLDTFEAVVTHVTRGSSRDGFDAEWREVFLLAIQGELLSRCELFDESDIDRALERFDQLSLPTPGLENAATLVLKDYLARFAARDWDVMAETLADNFVTDDRRRVVNAGVRRGRDAEIANMRSFADFGMLDITPTAIATRGERLVLCRHSVSFHDGTEPSSDVIGVVEIDVDNRILAHVMFDADDFDSALEELDARYAAGEAAVHAEVWSAIAEVFAALNRGEMPLASTNLVDVDHRSLAVIGSGGLMAHLQAASEDTPGGRIYIETVHRLTDLGAVTTHVAKLTSREGFDAEWRIASLFMVSGGLVERYKFFDEADLDRAITRFDQLSRPTPGSGNAASQVAERFLLYFGSCNFDAMAQLQAVDIYLDDRRRVVNAGIRRGRDAAVQDARANADVGANKVASSVIATRGERLALCRARYSGSAEPPETFHVDVLSIYEIDADERIAAIVTFGLNDFDAAIAELDARYLAGEAADHANAWSIVAGCYAALNRREIPGTTTNFVNVDHRRRTTPFAAGDVKAYTRAAWSQIPDISFLIESVHQLSDLGAVITHALRGTSQEGFEAEWREIHLMTLDGDLFNRSEFFDEADLNAALATFEELNRPTTHLENTASRVDTRFQACFAARDWDAMAAMVSDGFSIEDRRRVVNMGNLQGRDAEIGVHSYAVVGSENVTSTVIATRAQRLALSHYRFSGPDQRPDAFRIEMLALVEIDANDRMAAVVVFDADDMDAAIAELDARFLTGEASAHAHVWSVIASAIAAHNRRELAPTTPDVVSIDHRRVAAFAPGEGIEYLRAGWDLDQILNIYIETAHRLNDLGAVFTWTGQGKSHEGFTADWRGAILMTVDGEMVARSEVFDEKDLETALATFDQLTRSEPRLENAATRTLNRVHAYFAARDWAALGTVMATDVVDEDRRRVANAGMRRGRDAVVGGVQTAADLGARRIAMTVIAIRGDRLAFCRFRYSGQDQRPEAFYSEALGVFEIDVDGRVAAHVAFDLEDFDAAIAELDALYLAGEAAAYAHTWSRVTRAYAALNRRELPPTAQDWVNIDHRKLAPIAAGDLGAYLRATWDLSPQSGIYIENVHRLSEIGAVVTQVVNGLSHQGFDAEWRTIDLAMYEGDEIKRSELFDEADLDAALARFDELSRPARFETTASQAAERFSTAFADRDWESMAQILAADISVDDRRRGINAGLERGREAVIEDLRATINAGLSNATATVIATRGERLALTRFHLSEREQSPQAFKVEALHVYEINDDGQTATVVIFDPDDFEAGFAELGARYLAGEAASYTCTWSVIAEGCARANRHELPLTTSDHVYIDHRPLVAIDGVDFAASIGALWDITSAFSVYYESVHQLGELGAVVTQVVKATTHEGLDTELRMILLATVEGGLHSHLEVFDEADLDAALARFDELQQQLRRLENTASQVFEQFSARYVARDWDVVADMLADDIFNDDRRRVVNAGLRRGRAATIASMQASAAFGLSAITSTVIATRGERLALSRDRFSIRNQGLEEIVTEVLGIVEIDADERIVARLALDLDDFDAAIAELDARYVAGEAAAHADVWSVMTEGYALSNRREFPPTTPDHVHIDHRALVSSDGVDLAASLRALWDITSSSSFYAEAVHRLDELGAVVTHVVKATTEGGLDAEVRMIGMAIVEGQAFSRVEYFDEAKLDVAVGRFDEMHARTTRLENAASQVEHRFFAYWGARNWTVMAEILAEESFIDDTRRNVANVGFWDGRDVVVANMQVLAEISAAQDTTLTVIATRGERLVLTRRHSPNRDPSNGEFVSEGLIIAELDADDRIKAHIQFDADDIDAALAELDHRYLAGEAAAHTHTWSAIAGTFAKINRHEIPATTPNAVFIDRRPLISIEAVDAAALLSAALELTPHVRMYVEAVHRLSGIGAVVSVVARATSEEGSDVEWRLIDIMMFEDDRLSRCEAFDEADLDAALARFDELDRP